jgi:2-oxoglutarate dehydrogenase E1 component
MWSRIVDTPANPAEFSEETASVPVSPLGAVNAANAEFIDGLFTQYQQDPGSVDPQWAAFFAGFELAGKGSAPVGDLSAGGPEGGGTLPARVSQIGDLLHSYRELGHLIANLDPLGHNMTHHPLLELSEFAIKESDLDQKITVPSYQAGKELTVRELITRLQQTYCGTIGVEYMDIRDQEQRQWIQEQVEKNLNRATLSAEDRKQILRRMIATEEFELFLQRRFPTVKRFSNEGGDALIPLLDEIINTGAEAGVDEVLFGMAHRGRLSVLTHILHKPYEMIMSEVIGRPTFKTAGDGDVKYHLGYAYDLTTPTGKHVHLSLAANPSHLEIVNPVVEGMCRAKQNRKGDVNRERTIPCLIHGDAAFTGQGVVVETLYLSELEAYRTGGTMHVIINNQIGFTTNPSDGRFTRYPSDTAKAIQAPVFHVNADDPEAVVQAARLAMLFRARFQADAIVDLVCYRRRGHNEMDDASITQPVMAREIESHKTARQLYAQRLIDEGVLTIAEHEKMTEEVKGKLTAALDFAQTMRPENNPPPVHGPWAALAKMPKQIADYRWNTAVDKRTLKDITEKLCRVPEGFQIHPTVARMYKGRLDSVTGEKGIDWGCGEMLGLASLLNEGNWIRLTGQDVSRGTFSHRNAVWFDHHTGRPYVPMAAFAADRGGRLMIINSMLCEFAVVGFEYGFASADPQSLVIWEAQFGDFVNMTQPIIDQFIASSESKWSKYNGLVMLLPHGYEGQGPEHSHARLERFLQLCAEDNWQVVYPTTPAQMFHLLRRQQLRPFRKPLIVMTPKSMLRNPLCVSVLDEFANTNGFQHWLDETDTALDKSKVKRVLMCSGKVYYDLLAERTKRNIRDVAIIRLEQIYPFDSERLAEISKTYPKDVEILWVQEEPRNNGVYPFIGAKLHYHWAGMKKLTYVGRKPSASPAAGSHDQHHHEQQDIIERALGVTSSPKEMRDAKAIDVKVLDGKSAAAGHDVSSDHGVEVVTSAGKESK